MPRSYPLFLVAILAGGGWYFTKGPGAGKFGDVLASVHARANRLGQNAPAGNYPHPPSNYSELPTTADRRQYPPSTGELRVISAAPPAAAYAHVRRPRDSHRLVQHPGVRRRESVEAIRHGDAGRRSSTTSTSWRSRKSARRTTTSSTTSCARTSTRTAAFTTRSIGPRLGRSNSKEQYAFIYDTATIEVNRRSIYTVNDPDDLLHREPLVAMFRVRGPPAEQAFTFVLVDIHTDPDETDTELNALAQVYQAVRRASRRRRRHHRAGRLERRRQAPGRARPIGRRPPDRAATSSRTLARTPSTTTSSSTNPPRPSSPAAGACSTFSACKT